jgi:hypothetical protein
MVMAGEDIHILLIDDDKVDCELIGRLLKKTKFNYRLQIFHEGTQALTFLMSPAIKASKPKPAYLIMLDINLPSMDGFQVLERLQTACHHIYFKVYMFTTSSNYYDKEKAMAMGVQHYYLKKDLIVQQDLLHFMIQDFLDSVSTHY